VKNYCSKGNKMCRNPFKREEAEPLVFTRILRPPILRRISGGNDAAPPTAIRWIVRRMTGGIAEVHPPEHPATLPVNLRATSGKLAGHCRAFTRQSYQTFPPHSRQASAGITTAGSGHSPVSFPSYDRH
jgi:hypothetical protein